MSGGHFNYTQHNMNDSSESILKAITYNNTPNDWGFSRDYGEETLRLMRIAAVQVKKASMMLHQVDLLLSDDTGEDSFKENWKEQNLDD